MKPEAQRVAIAEACGWACVHSNEKSEFANNDSSVWHLRLKDRLISTFTWSTFKGKIENPTLANCIANLPDYLNDLNAIANAEEHARINIMDSDPFQNFLSNLFRSYRVEACGQGGAKTGSLGIVGHTPSSNFTSGQLAKWLALSPSFRRVG